MIWWGSQWSHITASLVFCRSDVGVSRIPVGSARLSCSLTVFHSTSHRKTAAAQTISVGVRDVQKREDSFWSRLKRTHTRTDARRTCVCLHIAHPVLQANHKRVYWDIVWRDHESDALNTWRLNTLTCLHLCQHKDVQLLSELPATLEPWKWWIELLQSSRLLRPFYFPTGPKSAGFSCFKILTSAPSSRSVENMNGQKFAEDTTEPQCRCSQKLY